MEKFYNKLIEIKSRLPRYPSKNDATLISNLYSEYEETLLRIIDTSDIYRINLFGYGSELSDIKNQIDRKKYVDAIKGMESDIESVISFIKLQENTD